MDSLDLLQKAWVLEVMYILLMLTTCLFFFPSRMADFLAALPLVTALIGGQGVLAAAGPEVKRLIETLTPKEKVQENPTAGLVG